MHLTHRVDCGLFFINYQFSPPPPTRNDLRDLKQQMTGQRRLVYFIATLLTLPLIALALMSFIQRASINTANAEFTDMNHLHMASYTLIKHVTAQRSACDRFIQGGDLLGYLDFVEITPVHESHALDSILPLLTLEETEILSAVSNTSIKVGDNENVFVSIPIPLVCSFFFGFFLFFSVWSFNLFGAKSFIINISFILPPFPLMGMRCCRSDWSGLCLLE